jgi:MFS family permease
MMWLWNKVGMLRRERNCTLVARVFLSALIGTAANKQIHLGDTLAKLGIDDNPPSLTADEEQATVRDLLEARSGVYHAAALAVGGVVGPIGAGRLAEKLGYNVFFYAFAAIATVAAAMFLLFMLETGPRRAK